MWFRKSYKLFCNYSILEKWCIYTEECKFGLLLQCTLGFGVRIAKFYFCVYYSLLRRCSENPTETADRCLQWIVNTPTYTPSALWLKMTQVQVQEEGCTGDHSEVDGKPFQQTSTSSENSSVALGLSIPSGVMPDWRNHAIIF